MVKRGVPKVLEERLLINNEDRVLLKTIEEMSPRDTGNIYVTGNALNLPVPTLHMISERLNKSEKDVLNQLKKIGKIWKIPDKNNLPTGNGIWDKEHAYIHAIGNQHKLRWDEKLGDYRVPKVHMFNALLSTGTLIANNDAFEGEKIVRQSLGLDDMLNSYNVQDGIMPEIIEIYGKAKHQRALLTGLNKTGRPKDPEKIEAARKTLEIEAHELTEKQWKNLEEYVFDTNNSFEEAAKSVAHEIAEMYKNIPEHVDIHWYFGASDFANMKEIESSLIAQRRITNREMKKANEELPKWRDELSELKQENAKNLVNKLLADKVYLYVNNQRSKFDDDEFPGNGKEFKGIVNKYFFNKGGQPAKRIQQLKENIKKKYEKTLGKSVELFDSIFDTAVIDYQEFSSFNQLKSHKEKQTDNLEKKTIKISTLEDKINETQRFENALIQEETQGPSWFTGHIAIKPTDAKVLQMVKKQRYKSLYEDILIPELKKLTGKNHRIHLHTDKIISVHVPDPEHQFNWENMNEEERKGVPIGTIMTSFPQTNVERSNEPIQGGFAQLQKFQQNILSERVREKREKAKTHGEFNKGDHGFSDFYFTGHAAEGYKSQTKFRIAPTRIQGEYSFDKEMTTFLKLPSRHDYKKLYNLMTKGNTGTWYAKRADKGGDTAGNVIVIDHPDRSQEQIFFNDKYYEEIGKKYGPRVKELENSIFELEEKVSRKGTKKYKESHEKKLNAAKKELENIYEEVKPEFYNVFNANDLHFGEWSWPGRFSLEEGIRASQMAALQSMGLDSMKYSIITEAFNGAQAFRSYDAKKLGTWKSAIDVRKNLNNLTEAMIKKGYSQKEMLIYRDLITQEITDGIVSPKLESQINDFTEYEQSLFHELMNNGTKVFVGMGNHHQASGKNMQSEGDIIVNILDSDKFYRNLGLLELGTAATSGQSYNYDHVALPGKNGKNIEGIVAHKMDHGRTEIDGPIEQMVKTKDNAVYGFTADRHHSGAVAQSGKMIVLDVGKPGVNPFVQMIGKASSTRGTQIPGYDPNGTNGYLSTRQFTDLVVEKIIGWDEKASILKTCHSLIEESMKDKSLYAKKVQIDQLTKSNYLNK